MQACHTPVYFLDQRGEFYSHAFFHTLNAWFKHSCSLEEFFFNSVVSLNIHGL